MNKVPTIHVPYSKTLIRSALSNEGYMVNTKKDAGIYFYSI